MRSNENKLSCGEQERARLRVEGLKSSENLSGTPARRRQERLVRCVHGFTGCSGAIKSSAATICHFPLRLTQVSVQTKRPRSGSPLRRSQVSSPCTTAVSL